MSIHHITEPGHYSFDGFGGLRRLTDEEVQFERLKKAVLTFERDAPSRGVVRKLLNAVGHRNIRQMSPTEQAAFYIRLQGAAVALGVEGI